MIKASKESAPVSAGQLLCELLEAAEVLENHVLLEDGQWDDTEVAVGVFVNLALRIRRQAGEEQLVVPITGDDWSCGRLKVGDALMAADSAVYHAEHPEAAAVAP